MAKKVSMAKRVNEILGTNYKRMTKKNWSDISCKQTLSEDFIREFQDKVDWVSISIYQKLSEDFIRELSDKVDLAFIFLFQKRCNEIYNECLEKVIKNDNLNIYFKMYEVEPYVKELDSLKECDDYNNLTEKDKGIADSLIDKMKRKVEFYK